MPAGPLTIYNTLSVSDIIYDRAGNSNNWNNVYSSVASTSANWNNVYSSVASTSSNWNNVYSSVASTSSNWNNVYSSVASTSANWNNVYSSVATTSASWDTVYSTVCALSTSWEESAEIIPTVTNYLSTNNVLLSSATITSGLQVNSNVLIYGNLSATGTSNFANTIFTTTTAISVVHVGSGPAMWVGNNGTGDIASFYDIDQNVEVLHVGGENSIDGSGVGIRTSFPNKALTVNGEISANNVIYDASGSSLNWNSVYSSVASTSANWNNVYTSVASTSGDWNSVFSTVCALSTSWEESADILPTVTNYLSTNSVLLSNLNVINNGSIGSFVLSGAGDVNTNGIYYITNFTNADLGIENTTEVVYAKNPNNPSSSYVVFRDGGPTGWYVRTNSGTTVYYNVCSLPWEGTWSIVPGRPSPAPTVTSASSGLNVSNSINVVGSLNVYTDINARGGNSVNWNLGYVGFTNLTANSANWQNTYNTVNSLSGQWDSSYNTIASLSANWQSTYSSVYATSANWDNVYSSVASTSANWDNTYTVTSSNSANWNLGYDGFTILNSNSANWNDTYTTVQSNSATTWNYQGQDLKALSAEWVGGNVAYTNLIANSAAYLSSVDLSFLSVSANWNDTYTTVQSNSATTWNYQGEDLKALSGEWVGGNIAYTNLIANSAAYLSSVDLSFLSVSANWNNVYSSVASTSSNWDNTYTTTNSNSANWNLGYAGFTGLTALSSNWEATYTAVQSNSSNWNTVYSTVCALSTSWEESADILPTVTNYLSTNNVLLSSATVTDNISARTITALNVTITDNLSTSVHITDLTTSKIFLSTDTCRVFHFDTSLQPLSAIFPSTLPDGFNVAIMNTGTNNLRLSAAQLNSIGITIGVRYGGAFIYKDNNQLFAVGRL